MITKWFSWSIHVWDESWPKQVWAWFSSWSEKISSSKSSGPTEFGTENSSWCLQGFLMFLYVSFNHENWGSYVLSGIPECVSVRLRTPLKRLLWLDSQSLAEKKMGSISPAWKCAMCIRCGAPQLAKFCFMSRLNDWVRGPPCELI